MDMWYIWFKKTNTQT